MEHMVNITIRRHAQQHFTLVVALPRAMLEEFTDADAVKVAGEVLSTQWGKPWSDTRHVKVISFNSEEEARQAASTIRNDIQEGAVFLKHMTLQYEDVCISFR